MTSSGNPVVGLLIVSVMPTVTTSSTHSLQVAKKLFAVSTEVTKPAGQMQDWPINKEDCIRTTEEIAIQMDLTCLHVLDCIFAARLALVPCRVIVLRLFAFRHYWYDS